MLLNLSILNFIIFEKIFIDFTEGFNVFTGETGAGKSMIIDSMNLLLGGKSNKNFVRKGCNKATVQGSFYIEKNSPLISLLQDNDIEADDNTIIITREIYDNGRSVAKINDIMINLSFLKSASKHLLDIHGQYEQQSILNSDEHIIILDKMCGSEMSLLLDNYSALYKKYTDISSEIYSLENSNHDKISRIDYLNFQINEIESSALKPGEEEELFNEFNILSNLNAIKLNVSNASNLLNSDNQSALELLSDSLKSIMKVSHYDENLKNFENTLELLIDNCQELSYNLVNYIDEKDLDEERLNFLNDRLELLNRLKRKYSMKIDEIIAYKEKAHAELTMLKNIENTLAKKASQLKNIMIEMDLLAEKLFELRTKKASIVERDIVNQLHSLNMKDASFKIRISHENIYNINGKDKVHFLISTNLGVELMPLEKILSGGEVSRIMLAIKSIINEIDEVPTMIFDEIDAGISGKTAHLVGEKIKNLSKSHQIICVTHSPQISSASQSHFKIEKKSDGKITYSSITKLGRKERIEEIARLLSGKDITETSLRNAEEMINLN
jgi:DNA repair protein RecN (Recombination protein N)